MAYVDWVTQFGATTSSTDVVITGAMEIEIRSNVVCRRLTTQEGAKLRFKTDTSAELFIWHLFEHDGELIMEPNSFSVFHTITFEGIDVQTFVGGGLDVLETDPGLWVRHEGWLTIDGPYRKAWTRLLSSASAGNTVLPLQAAPSGWQVGDKLVICPTEPITTALWYTHFDEVTITAISTNTVTVTPALVYPHPATNIGDGLTMTAEVLNLTRNVMIRGRLGAEAHIHVHAHNNLSSIKQLRLDFMGPRKNSTRSGVILGRYPLHFHHGFDESRGVFMDSVVSTNSRARAFVPHFSHGIAFRGCIAYKTIETPFWWDSDDETHDILYDRCVAAWVYDQPAQAGDRLTGFQAESGIGSTMQGCITVGVQGTGKSSGFNWPGGSTHLRLWIFENCVAHNNKLNGIMVWQNTTQNHIVEKYIAYHCGQLGIEQGAYHNHYQYRNSILFGCLGGIGLHNQSSTFAPTRFHRIHIRGNGVMGRGVNMFLHLRPPESGKQEFDGLIIDGYTTCAFGGGGWSETLEHAGHLDGGTAEFSQVTNSTFTPATGSGAPNFLWDSIKAGSLISVDNGGQAFDLRRFDETGTLVPEWNARKTNIASFAPAPTAFQVPVLSVLADTAEAAPGGGDPQDPPTGTTITIVMTPPLPPSSAWRPVASVTITATATPGGALIEYQEDDDPAWVTYTAPVVVTLEGAHFFVFRATSAAVVSELADFGFQIDRTAPVTAASLSPGVGVTTVTLEAVDPFPVDVDLVSGIALTEYDLDNAGYVEYTGPFAVSTANAHTVLYRSEDVAGNQETERLLSIPVGALVPVFGRSRRRQRV